MNWGDDDMEKQKEQTKETATSEEIRKVMDEVTEEHDELFRKLAKN